MWIITAVRLSELSEQILDYLKKSASSLLSVQEPSDLFGWFFLQNSSPFEPETVVLVRTILGF